ncbi:hypothetical protein NT239_11345 [Chitinibacter sp. SCUT-21]|uniref:hypothetical protein n=1 Tax=Chitinibacter sp. SCUT-21 TaxID=2970891 RepID=UPI0035A70A00
MNLSLQLRRESSMRFVFFIVITAWPLLGLAKDIRIRANIEPQCRAMEMSPAKGGKIDANRVEMKFDCQAKMAWAKVHQFKEQQWQRISFDY